MRSENYSQDENSQKYFLHTEISGPAKIKSGESGRITLNLEVERGKPEGRAFELSAMSSYSVKAQLETINFQASDLGISREGSILSLKNPVSYTWVILPVEKKLGSQVVVVYVHLEDVSRPKELPYPYGIHLAMKIEILNPLGLPPSLVYSGILLGSILSLPFLSWLLKGFIVKYFPGLASVSKKL